MKIKDCPNLKRGRILCVDPAASKVDFAIYQDGGLMAAGTAMPTHIAGSYDAVVVETPRNYGSFAVAHKDLDRLRRMLKALHKCVKTTKWLEVYPSSWKGNVPKRIHHMRVFPVYDPDERMDYINPRHAEYDHNIADAAALGLWATGRVGRGGAHA